MSSEHADKQKIIIDNEKICSFYRTAYNMYIVSSWLFNHESERRAHNFVTQKIAQYVGKYFKNKDISPLQIGNLNSKRDWGHAKDYIEAISLIIEQDIPEDYVIASGETHSVRKFIILAFKRINVDIVFQGDGLEEVGIDKNTGKVIVLVNPKYLRALELNVLIGDSSKAREKLGWKPTINFETLVNLMVDNACNLIV